MTLDAAHILVVDDDTRLRALLLKFLAEQGFRVTEASDAMDARGKMVSLAFDLIVLDVMMPGESGLDLIRSLRPDNAVPVLLLTARGESGDRIEGFESGADDYLVKPFAFAELLARLRALIRRQPVLRGNVLQVADLTMDTVTRQGSRGSEGVDLTAKEFALLEYLMRHPNQVLSRTVIAEHVWNYDFDNATNVIDVHVKNLRKKIDGTGGPKLIHTVRGAGYLISDRGAG